MKKINLIFILSIIFLSGCIVFPRKTYKYPNCYNGKNTGLDSILNLNGYYYIIDSLDDNGNFIPPEKRTNYFLILYKDGFFAHSFSDKFDEKYFDWGLYRIENDTLKIKFVRSGLRKWRYFGEAWYKIVNDTLIEALLFRYSGGITHELVESRFDYEEYRTLYAKFIPCDTLPDPNKARIKKDKYFWCNKEQYKKWKKEQKMQKHKNK